MRLTKAQEQYAWPPRCHLRFYRKDGSGGYVLWLESRSRLFDLADNVTPDHPYRTRTVYFGVTARGNKWRMWNVSNVEKVEWRIRYDLRFDGHPVSIRRLTPVDDRPCSKEFLWRLVVGREGG